MNCKNCTDYGCGGQGSDFQNQNCGGKSYKAPPIGIEPKSLWIGERQRAILEAMNRYIQADAKIPIKWLEEYNDLIDLNV